MISVLEKCAEILCKCGYAEHHTDDGTELVWQEPELDHLYESVNPFADTLIGRKQADAIEDYLRNPNNIDASHCWNQSGCQFFEHGDKHHQWRLDRIKWCVEQLIKAGK